jgi:hypothetical protein
MHYKNGRAASIGDWVIGPTHNSEGKILVGKVLELMPQQGPCNVRLHAYYWFGFRPTQPNDDMHGELVHVKRGDKPEAYWLEGRQDFADAAALVPAADAFQMLSAVVEHGAWNGRFSSI